MQQLGSGLDSAGRLLELYWRAVARVEMGPAEGYGVAAEGSDVMQPYWSSTEKRSRKPEIWGSVNIEYEGK